jgi:hypothetical protein
MKYKIPVAVLTVIVVVFLLFKKNSELSESVAIENRIPNANLSAQPNASRLVNRDQKIDQSASVSAVSTAQSSSVSSLISMKDFRKHLRLPKDGIIEYVASIFDQQDKDGTINYMLAKAFSICEIAPQNEIELQERKKMYEEASLNAGDDNGETQENIERAEKEYFTCKELKARYPNLHAYDFFYKSALLGNSNSKFVIAAMYTPPKYDNWSFEEKEIHKKNMGKMLSEARSQCEPGAFLAFANGRGFDEGKLWVDPNPLPEKIRRLANLSTYNLIYSNKFSDGQSDYIAQATQLAASMAEEDRIFSEQEGNRMYNNYCSEVIFR